VTAVGALIVIVALTWITALVVVVHTIRAHPGRGQRTRGTNPTSDERRHHQRWP
jgi:hypothetical protein